MTPGGNTDLLQCLVLAAECGDLERVRVYAEQLQTSAVTPNEILPPTVRKWKMREVPPPWEPYSKSAEVSVPAAVGVPAELRRDRRRKK